MKVEVAYKDNESTTQKGDKFENLIKKYFESQGYECYTKIMDKGGFEVDVWGVHRDDSSLLMAEAKAHNKAIQTDDLTKFFGKYSSEGEQDKKGYFISLNGFGKAAKQFLIKIEKEKLYGIDGISFIKRLPENLIKDYKYVQPELSKLESCHNSLKVMPEDDHMVLIIESEILYLIKVRWNGNDGLLFFDARTGNLISNKGEIDRLKAYKHSYSEIDHEVVFEILEKTDFEKEYKKKLQEIDIKLSHPIGRELKLDDIYIWLDFEDEDGESFSSKEIFQYSQVVIHGDTLSGKTALLRKLQQELLSENDVAVLIDGSSIKKSSPEGFKNLVESELRKQFNKKINFSLEEITILIDNFEENDLRNDAALQKLIENLSKFKRTYITIDNDFEFKITRESEKAIIFNKFKKFKIKSLGHSLRLDLVDKWVNLGGFDDQTNEEKIHLTEEQLSHIQNSLKTDFVEIVPAFVLLLLSNFLNPDNSLKEQTKQAKLYTVIIETHLAHVGGVRDFEIVKNIISEISWEIYSDGTDRMKEGKLREVIAAYLDSRDLERDEESIYKKIKTSNIFIEKEDGIKFRHKYYLYHFLGLYLFNNNSKLTVQEEIDGIVERLDLKHNNNILLFYLYHCGGDESMRILNIILKKVEEHFKDIEELSLNEGELDVFEKIIKEEIELPVKDESSKTIQKKKQKILDDIEEDRKKIKKDSIDEEIEQINQISYGVKLVELAGQILKNNAQNLDSKKKLRIVDESMKLTSRIVNKILKDIENNVPIFRMKILEILDEDQSKSKGISEATANRIIGQFALNIVLSGIGVSAIHLADRDILKTVDKEFTQSKEDGNRFRALMSLGIKYYYPNTINTREVNKLGGEISMMMGQDTISSRVLKRIIRRHLSYYVSDPTLKQKICSSVGLQYQAREYLAPKDR